jgi:hypothetical protein
MFTTADYDKGDRESVAICLYGSMDNFPEYVQEAGPGFRDGWVSSSAPAVYNFIKSHGKQFDDPYLEPEEMAVEALLIADGQGLSPAFSGDARGTDRAWERALTYGDAPKAQWLAQIYLDVDLLATESGRQDGFRRVLIGAPLWIRTPDPQAVDLYAMSNNPEILQARQTRARRRIIEAGEPSPRASADRIIDSYPGMPAFEVQEEEGEHEEESSRAPRSGLTIALPYRIYGALKDGFVKGEADWLMREVVESSGDDRVLHLGDPFGRVFAWVWNDDKDDAVRMLSDYLAELREGHLLASQIDPPIRLDEVLGGLRLALPRGFSDYDEVVTKARREIRRYYGEDPNK